jgi:N-acyl homoserine lactone hydrolase
MTRLTLRSFYLTAPALLALASLASAAEPVSALRVQVLDCGSMRGIPSGDLLAEVPDPPGRVDMVNRCFLVEHPKGRLLWDTGFPRTFGTRMKMFAFSVTSFGRAGVDLGEPVPEQLEKLGLDDDDVDWLALSHIHWDHAGGANDFEDSTWIVQQRDLDWAFTDADVERPHVDPSNYEELEDSEKYVLQGEDFDVFGDGSVVILSTPGHTPGHQSLFLDLPITGPVIVSGDLYHTVLNRKHRAPPSFNTDAAETRRSMQRIERLLEERSAQLWIQHDASTGPAAPALVE